MHAVPDEAAVNVLNQEVGLHDHQENTEVSKTKLINVRVEKTIMLGPE